MELLPNEIIYNILDRLPVPTLVKVLETDSRMNSFNDLFRNKIRDYIEMIKINLKSVFDYLRLFWVGMTYENNHFVLPTEDDFRWEVHELVQNDYPSLDDDEFDAKIKIEYDRYLELYNSLDQIISDVGVYVYFKNTQKSISLGIENRIFVNPPITPAKIIIAFSDLFRESLIDPDDYEDYLLAEYSGYNTVKFLRFDSDFNAHIIIH